MLIRSNRTKTLFLVAEITFIVMAFCGCAAPGWEMPWDRWNKQERVVIAEPSRVRTCESRVPEELFALPPIAPLPREEAIVPAPVGSGSRTEKMVIVPRGGVPVNEAFTVVGAELISPRILAMGQEGVLALTDGDELLCINYIEGDREWFAVFTTFEAQKEMIFFGSLAVFANRERCVVRYKNRRRDELSTRQMDWVIDELDRRNEDKAAATKLPEPAGTQK